MATQGSQFNQTTVNGQFIAGEVSLNGQKLKFSPSTTTSLDSPGMADTIPTAQQLVDYIKSQSAVITHSITATDFAEDFPLNFTVNNSKNTGVVFKVITTIDNHLSRTGWIAKNTDENDINCTDWSLSPTMQRNIDTVTIPYGGQYAAFGEIKINGTLDRLTTDSGKEGIVNTFDGKLKIRSGSSTGTLTLPTNSNLNTLVNAGTIALYNGDAGTITSFLGGSGSNKTSTITSMKGRVSVLNIGESKNAGGEDAAITDSMISVTSITNGTIDVDLGSSGKVSVSKGTSTPLTVGLSETVSRVNHSGTITTFNSANGKIGTLSGTLSINSNSSNGNITLNNTLNNITISGGSGVSTVANNKSISTYSGTGTIVEYTNTGAIGAMTGDRTINQLGKVVNDANITGRITIKDNTLGSLIVAASNRAQAGSIAIGPSTGVGYLTVNGYTVKIGASQSQITITKSNNGELILASPTFKPGSISGQATASGNGNCSIREITTSETGNGIELTAAGRASATQGTWNTTTAGWLTAKDTNNGLNNAITSTDISTKKYYISAITIADGKTLGSSSEAGATVTGTLYANGEGVLRTKVASIYMDRASTADVYGSATKATGAGSIRVIANNSLGITNDGTIYFPNFTLVSSAATVNSGQSLTAIVKSGGSATATNSGDMAITNTGTMTITNNNTIVLDGWTISSTSDEVIFS